ncbi:MAG: hypothetical protein V3U50_03410 [Acidimicrobiia bacterium]
MSDNDQHSGIFDGTDAIIASFFGLRDDQHLKQQSVSRGLDDPGNVDGGFLALVSSLYGRIESNHTSRLPSRENWRSKRVTTLSDHNKSPEVLLERAVAMLGEAGTMPDWLNQVPVASGLINDRFDKRAALDLVKLEDDVARFVELKWESDTPAYAAFEVLRYGLVYLFSRVNVVEFGYADRRMMRVGRVDLQVLAPTVFFDKHDLGWLERGLDHAVDDISRQKTSDQLSMGFEFLALPPEFELPFRDGAEVRATCEAEPPAESARRVCDAFDNLSPVWPAKKDSPA